MFPSIQKRANCTRAALICAALVFALPLCGQERSGNLIGTVTDPSGAVLPGVSVTLVNKTTDRTFTTTTRADGTYGAFDLDPGRYAVRMERTGFARYEVPDVNLLVGKTLRIDATMQVGSIEQTVQVTEAAPQIDTSSTVVAHNVTAEEFDRLPKGRTFLELSRLSPSVNTGEVEGGVQVNGASGAENQFNIDGVSVTSLINGKARQGAIFEFLQEVQVKTAGIEADYGGALGGVVSAVTKSGTNDFHGDVHYYYFGNALSAGPTRRLLLDPITETTAKFVQDHKFPLNNHEFGGAFSGPIVKNRLWFFAGASPRWVRRSNTYLFFDGQRGEIDQEQTHHTTFAKVNFDPHQRVRTAFTWLWTPVKSVGRLPAFNYEGNSLTSSAQANSVYGRVGYFNPQTSYTGTIDLTLTNTSVLSIRGGRYWDNYKDTGIPSISSVTYQTSAIGLPFSILAELQQPTGFFNTPRLLVNDHDLATRAYVQADFSQYARFLGSHNLKLGVGTSKWVNNVFNQYPGGYVYVYWDRAFRSNATGLTDRGALGYYEVDFIGTEGSAGANIRHLYIHDQWRIHPRLTLSLGLRAENEVVPSMARDVQDKAFEFGFSDKLAPRLGASLDVFGDGRMKVFGSWGRYFDWVKYELVRGTFGGDFWRVFYRSLDTLDVFSLGNNTNMPGRDIWNPSVPNSFRNRRVPGFDTVAPGIKPMSTDLINAGIEYQLASNVVLRGSYVRNNLRRTIEDLGVLIGGDEVYFYANPGEGTATITPPSGATAPFPTPKPKRTYDAMELSITRRWSGGWLGSASYVYSRLYGNYAGIAASDEIRTPTTGVSSATAQQQGGSIAREGGNANRAWDIDELLWDSRGNLDVRGRLATDRPHVLKLYGSRDFRINGSNTTNLGLFFYAGSGTPLTTYVNTINQTEVMVNGRGDMGRTPFLTQTDLVLAHEVRVSESKTLRFEFNALNLFNQKIARHRFNSLNRGAGAPRQSSAIDLHDVDLARGYDYRALINATPDQMTGIGAFDPRYGLDDLFNTGFAGRFGVKFTF